MSHIIIEVKAMELVIVYDFTSICIPCYQDIWSFQCNKLVIDFFPT